MPIHFGVNVTPGKYGLKISKDKYAWINTRSSTFNMNYYETMVQMGKFPKDDRVDINGKRVKLYSDEMGRFYTEEFCEELREVCLRNFDLNMSFFSKLDVDKFNKEIESFLIKNKRFKEVFDLNSCKNVGGYYVMVLGEYKQVYVGRANDIHKRIRQHWATNKPFDRLIFPAHAEKTSKISIDSFRSMDTTRILVMKAKDTYSYEDDFINDFSDEFVLNRISGGIVGINSPRILSEIKFRDL